MFEIAWLQNGAVCSARTYSVDEAADMAASAYKYYVLTRITFTDGVL